MSTSVNRCIESMESRILLAATAIITETITNPVDVNETTDINIYRILGNTLDGVDPDLNNPSVNDNIVVRPSTDNLNVEVFLNGAFFASAAKGTFDGILLAGLQGFDTLTVLTTEDPANAGTFFEVDVPVSIQAGKGNDVVNGGPETTIVNGGVGNDSISGGVGNDVIRGGRGDDVLRGGLGRDSIFGAGGNDVIVGGRGADTLMGGPGSDSINGGLFNDLLTGGPEAIDETRVDTLVGEAGDDTLYADASDGDTTDPTPLGTDSVFATSILIPISVQTHVGDFVTVNNENELRDLNRNFTLQAKIASFIFNNS